MMKSRFVSLFIVPFCLLCCGGNVARDSEGTREAQLGVPAIHRAVGVACPEDRGAGTARTEQDADECGQDSDCHAGMNGRCLWFNRNYCSYDTCHNDSDCSENRPCECRTSSVDSVANYCVTTGGDCRVDSDCGQNGYCSPSQILTSCFCDSSEECGQGYFCHTPQDTCLDDSDCGSSAICAYHLDVRRWACSGCSFPY